SGLKLRGVWTLVKTKGGGPNDWLMIKKPDAWSKTGAEAALPQESIFSGLSVEELREGRNRAAELHEELTHLGADRGRVDAEKVPIMLAETRDRPFSAPGWLFEL